jgi:hypothetical protein
MLKNSVRRRFWHEHCCEPPGLPKQLTGDLPIEVPMRKSKADFAQLIASGQYYVVQKVNDRNRDDLTIMREDGHPAEIHNYPYRTNQMPAYVLKEFLNEGLLKEDGTGEHGGTIFRATDKALRPTVRAA